MRSGMLAFLAGAALVVGAAGTAGAAHAADAGHARSGPPAAAAGSSEQHDGEGNAHYDRPRHDNPSENRCTPQKGQDGTIQQRPGCEHDVRCDCSHRHSEPSPEHRGAHQAQPASAGAQSAP